jgi:S-DNA-T family DNA segregation ATPase FtsK/SpoIIIE
MNLPGLPNMNPGSSRRLLRRSFKVKLKRSTLFSIGSVIFFALAALVLLSFLRQGPLLVKFNDYLVQFFGWGVLFLPFIFLVSGLLLTRLKTAINEPHVLVGAALLALSLMGLAKTGLIGREVWFGIVSMITMPGALIVLLGGILIGLIVLFNTSIDQVILLIVSFFKKARGYLIVARTPNVPRMLDQKVMEIQAQSKSQEQVHRKPITLSETEEFNPLTSTQTGVWEYPPLSLLSESSGGKADRGNVNNNAAVIEKTLDSFGISARVIDINPGPAVTQYALEVALGTKLSKITALSNDLALALAAPHGLIRIEAPIPGKSQVGIELPNRTAEFVTLRKMLEADILKNAKSKLTVALGLDVAGNPMVADIGRMPHVLIAGATGSGKTVCLNAFIATLLYRTTPNELKFIMVDPKRVEMTQYNGIPHLLTPVIVEPDKVLSALKWATREMERRYKMFAQVGVRNLDAYNEASGFSALPYIIILIDELADIMLFAPVEVEDTICRIAQMARATGIHLVLATQRPSVDILTALIKANIPCRISFAVSSMVDSRVIIDGVGAEKLLGRGDMLYVPPDQARPTRVQGALVSDQEIGRLIDFLRKKSPPAYTEEVTSIPVTLSRRSGGFDSGARDPLFVEALRQVVEEKEASSSRLQRRFALGYSRAARILDQLEAVGAVGPKEGSKAREVLVKDADEFLAGLEQTS